MTSLSIMISDGSLKSVDLERLHSYMPQKGEVIMFDGRVEDYSFELLGSDVVLTLPNGEEFVLIGFADLLANQDEESPTKLTIANGEDGDVLVVDSFGTLTEIMEAAAAGEEVQPSSLLSSGSFETVIEETTPESEEIVAENTRRSFELDNSLNDSTSSNRVDTNNTASNDTILNETTFSSINTLDDNTTETDTDDTDTSNDSDTDTQTDDTTNNDNTDTQDDSNTNDENVDRTIDLNISSVANTSVVVLGDSINLNGYTKNDLGSLSENANIDSSNGKNYLVVDDISSGVTISSGNAKDILQINGDILGSASYDGGNGKDTLILGKTESNYTLSDYTDTHGVISALITDNDTGETLSVKNIEEIRYSIPTYEYSVSIDGEVSQDVTIDNLPSNITLKNSLGEEVSPNEDGSYTITTDSDGDTTLTIVSSEELQEESLNTITATISYEDNYNLQTDVNSYDSLILEDDSTLSFDELKEDNINGLDEINMDGGDKGSVIDGIEIEDVLVVTQVDNTDTQIMKIIGDLNDEVKIDTTKWQKSDGLVVEDGNEFHIYEGVGEDVKLYIDTDIVITDI